MRIQDLIRSIGDCSTTHRHSVVTDTERLTLLRESFSRPDLLEWYDQLGAGALLPSAYFPELLHKFAEQTHLRWQLVHELVLSCTNSKEQYDLLEHPQGAEITKSTVDTNGDISLPGTLPPIHLIGLVYATLDSLEQLPVLKAGLSINTYNSLRIFILADVVYQEYFASKHLYSAPKNSFELYNGELQYWGLEKNYIICYTNMQYNGN